MIPRAARRALHSLPVALLAACFGLGIAPLSARPRPNPAPTGEHVSERQLPVAERVTTHVRRHLDDAKARLRRSEFGPAFQAWVRAFELRPSPDVGAFLVKWSQTEAPGLRPPYFESLDREQRRQLLAMIGAHHPGRLRLLGWLDPAPTDRPPVVTARRFCSSSLDSATCLRWLARVELSERSLRWLIRERRVRVASLWSAASRSARSGRLALAIRFYGWLTRVDSESSSRALNRIGEIRLRQNRFRDARRLFLASIAEGVGRMPWPPAETALSRLVSLLPLTDVPRRAVELLLRVDSDHAFNRIYDLAGRFQHLGGRSGATFCLDFLVRRSRDVLVRAYALVDRLKLETTFAAFARLARVELPQLWRDAQREQKPNGGQLVLRRVVLRLLRHAA
ncbi:MAG: hypothetical protein KC609_18775, partial [Myxococcales bacterium]|nr:hypothetical protein [Myxococcales bacterium]